jgi:hypothetical protein
MAARASITGSQARTGALSEVSGVVTMLTPDILHYVVDIPVIFVCNRAGDGE